MDFLFKAFRAVSGLGTPTAAGSEILSPREVEVLAMLRAQPKLSARDLGERLGISQRAIDKHLSALKRQGRLRRLGSPRAGSWQVLPPSARD
jgi:DNA-binding MarR family transcriptional regulator